MKVSRTKLPERDNGGVFVCVTRMVLWTFGGLLLNITLDTTHLNRAYHPEQDNTGNGVCVHVCVCVCKDSALKWSKGLFVTYLYNTAILYWTQRID